MNWNIIDNRVSPTTSRVDCESLLDRITEGSDPAWWEPKTRPAQNTTRYVSSEEEPTIDWVSSGLLSTGRLYFGPPDNNDYDQTTQRLCTHPSLVQHDGLATDTGGGGLLQSLTHYLQQ